MKIFFVLLLLFATSFSYGQQTYTFTRDPKKGSTSVDSVKTKKTTIHLWEDGRRMDDKEVKEAMQLSGIDRRFEIRSDTVFMFYKILSTKDLEERKQKAENDLAAYKARYTNKATPAFSVTDINGKTYSTANLKGKIVVLNFWFIGCKPCRKEMPQLNALVEDKKNKEVLFIGLALDKKESLEGFLRDNNFLYTIIPDAKDIASLFQVTAYPTHVVIDKQGVVRELIVGGDETVGKYLDNTIHKYQMEK